MNRYVCMSCFINNYRNIFAFGVLLTYLTYKNSDLEYWSVKFQYAELGPYYLLIVPKRIPDIACLGTSSKPL